MKGLKHYLVLLGETTELIYLNFGPRWDFLSASNRSQNIWSCILVSKAVPALFLELIFVPFQTRLRLGPAGSRRTAGCVSVSVRPCRPRTSMYPHICVNIAVCIAPMFTWSSVCLRAALQALDAGRAAATRWRRTPCWGPASARSQEEENGETEKMRMESDQPRSQSDAEGLL